MTQRNSQGDETVANAQLVCEKIAILWVMLAKNMQDPNFKAILADEKQSYAFSKTVMSEIRSLGQLTRYKADFVIKETGL
ncbi:MAG: hypothetical protein HWD59_14445 [Coxiellaceae bacterium]|nr:MAG: hypothetical protein HWD59_14445 [Coxiellaceae bacterium]